MEIRLGEINIFVTNRERSLSFYRDLLGFGVVGEEDGALHLEGAGHRFLLMPSAVAAGSSGPYGSRPAVSFDLEVCDIEAAYSLFCKNGVEIEKKLAPNGDHFFVRDPDGIVIEILCR